MPVVDAGDRRSVQEVLALAGSMSVLEIVPKGVGEELSSRMTRVTQRRF
jgi:hypothetical protein